MADSNIINRISLEDRFKEGDIPEERHFKELIHSSFNQNDDGIRKSKDSALEILAPVRAAGDIKEFIHFTEDFDLKPKWRLGIANLSGATTRKGFSVSDTSDPNAIRLFITDQGKIGIANNNPSTELDVGGTVTATRLNGEIQPTRGSGAGAGLFFSEAGSSNNQAALIQYHENALQSQKEVLRIETKATGSDIVLMPAGMLGVGVENPQAKLDLNGTLRVAGITRVVGRENVEINPNPIAGGVMIQLAPKVGLGRTNDHLFYKGDQHIWRNRNDVNPANAMVLDASNEGGLTLAGTGVSTFGGTLQVEGDGDSSFAGALEVGNLTVSGTTHLKGALEVANGQPLRFTQASGANSLSIELAANLGFGMATNTLLYAASDRQAWVVKNGSSTTERMVLNMGPNGGLTISGTGQSTFAGSVKIDRAAIVLGEMAVGKPTVDNGFKLDVSGAAQIGGNLRVKGAQLLFASNSGNSDKLKIHFGGKMGVGTDQTIQFYAAEVHRWQDTNGVERMRLKPGSNGGLLVEGTGQSLFKGTLRVNSTGISSVNGKLGIGTSSVSGGFQMEVNGKLKTQESHSTGDHRANRFVAGNTIISNGSIKIGNQTITEHDLRILNLLSSNQLHVKIMSRNGHVLDNFHDRVQDGDRDRTIQFQRDHGFIQTRMKLVMWL